MRKILPQAYNEYYEDKILSITQSLGEKTIFQGNLMPNVFETECWQHCAVNFAVMP
ncbi:MAG: hypothetical protein KKI01_08190 [Proteobacteria bacterium]|jgi:hypothetical protein|nr:hypothetical protein [Pseudomonadota bacterium]